MSEIYAVKIHHPVPEVLYNKFLQFVSNKKRERVKKFLRREDAERTLIGDVMIRTIVFEDLKIGTLSLEFHHNDFGKPYIPTLDDFHFNISHSGEWVVCATDHSAIGIDVEKIKPIDFAIAERFYSPVEYKDLLDKKPHDRLSYFYDLWSLKESFIKAKGRGLYISLHSFSIRKKGAHITLQHDDPDEQWYFIQYPLEKEYKLSVCATNYHFPQEVRVFTMKELEHRLIQQEMTTG